MTRFRSNIKRVAGSALLAFVLWSAPPTDDGIGAVARAAPTMAPRQPLADTANAGDLAAFSQASEPRLAGPPDSGPRPSSHCRVCSAFATANSILFAPPPLLLLPQMLEFLYQASDAEFAHLKTVDLSFRRRSAPPSRPVQDLHKTQQASVVVSP